MLMRNKIDRQAHELNDQDEEEKNSRTKYFLSINEGGLEWNIWLNIQKNKREIEGWNNTPCWEAIDSLKRSIKIDKGIKFVINLDIEI